MTLCLQYFRHSQTASSSTEDRSMFMERLEREGEREGGRGEGGETEGEREKLLWKGEGKVG